MHQFCKDVEKFCQANKLRFTEPRRLVLEVIAASDAPIGAYEILERIGQISERPKPATVYRAIEFFQTHGFIHKIESLNTFAICRAGHAHTGSQFMICDQCGFVSEIHLCHLPDSLEKKTKNSGFTIAYWNTEVHGRCRDCTEI